MKRVTLFAGHYGSGKTNLAVNKALEIAKTGRKTLIADLDIVNPYFRTRDSEKELRAANVEFIVSPYANTNVDVPALPQEMYRITDDKSCHAVIDVGGDDRGALALGRLAPALMEENDYEMYFVVNFFRPLTRDIEGVLKVLYEVQEASHMRVTHLVNNSNLGQMTTAEDIIGTDAKMKALSDACGLPVCATTVRTDLFDSVKAHVLIAVPVDLHFRTDWVIY